MALIDLLAIMHFYLPFIVDLRFLRMMRLFRLFRLLRVLTPTPSPVPTTMLTVLPVALPQLTTVAPTST